MRGRIHTATRPPLRQSRRRRGRGSAEGATPTGSATTNAGRISPTDSTASGMDADSSPRHVSWHSVATPPRATQNRASHASPPFSQTASSAEEKRTGRDLNRAEPRQTSTRQTPQAVAIPEPERRGASTDTIARQRFRVRREPQWPNDGSRLVSPRAPGPDRLRLGQCFRRCLQAS